MATFWTFSNPGGGWEFPVFWIVLLFVQFLLGYGAFAAGSIVRRERPVEGKLATA